MLHLIVGKQGSGKTIYLVKKAKKYHDSGFKVYSNVHLNFPYEKLNYKDIIDCKLENGIVILDEIHQLLPSRNSMSTTSRKICDSFLSMIRKKGLEVFGSTQTPRKVDVRFREEADYFYVATKYAYLNKKWVEVFHNQNLSRNIPIMIKLDITEQFSGTTIQKSFIANEIFSLYDTNQIIKITGI